MAASYEYADPPTSPRPLSAPPPTSPTIPTSSPTPSRPSSPTSTATSVTKTSTRSTRCTRPASTGSAAGCSASPPLALRQCRRPLRRQRPRLLPPLQGDVAPTTPSPGSPPPRRGLGQLLQPLRSSCPLGWTSGCGTWWTSSCSSSRATASAGPSSRARPRTSSSSSSSMIRYRYRHDIDLACHSVYSGVSVSRTRYKYTTPRY
ncbi:uncharacterized protein M6B38_364935 [Iris pallida]|uniref:Uncharacterized protein n=1 Tax=Iris pallida TaxID=29817 RepID=A0AAX6GIR2_IRIPA|nr:uncharacterized protein M6B38_364935 [Iris pallida]